VPKFCLWHFSAIPSKADYSRFGAESGSVWEFIAQRIPNGRN
jgi:hypothetical protein